MHVICDVDDLQRTLGFYEHAFGRAPKERIDSANCVELYSRAGGTLALYERTAFAAEDGADPI